MPEENVKERIQLAGLTEYKAKRYQDTLKILELADKGMKSADIAKTINISLREVQQLRRTAVDTIDYVEERIKSNTIKSNEAMKQ